MWRLSYQNGSTEVIFFINLRPPVVYWPYSPSYDSSNFPIYEICSWKMAIDDLKIAAIILYIGSPLGNIYSKYAIVYCEYNLHFIIYICWLAILCMCDLGGQTCNTFIKHGQIFV